MRRVLTLIALVAASGCGASAVTSVARPAQGGHFAKNRVVVPNGMWDEAVLDLPRGALDSEAELVELDKRRACFDVVVRTWRGASDNWRVDLDLDDRELDPTGWKPFACNRGDSCLPPDTRLASKPSDDSSQIRVRGSRLCFTNLGVPARDVHRVELRATQGAYTLAFAWQLQAPR